MLKYLKFIIRDSLGLNNDYENLLLNQDKILENLKELENQIKDYQNQQNLEEKEINYIDYISLKNILYVLLFIIIVGSGFLSGNTLESFKLLGKLSKNLHVEDIKGLLEALKKLNENTVNLSKEEIKLLLEIKNLLIKKKSIKIHLYY
jgi:hypothetical protein